jgi:hypothetical protein
MVGELDGGYVAGEMKVLRNTPSYQAGAGLLRFGSCFSPGSRMRTDLAPKHEEAGKNILSLNAKQ